LRSGPRAYIILLNKIHHSYHTHNMSYRFLGYASGGGSLSTIDGSVRMILVRRGDHIRRLQRLVWGAEPSRLIEEESVIIFGHAFAVPKSYSSVHTVIVSLGSSGDSVLVSCLCRVAAFLDFALRFDFWVCGGQRLSGLAKGLAVGCNTRR
jgi:hypothetical protein